MGGETGPEQQYSLRWNDFHASILSSFRHLRDEEDFVDVTLACDGRSFTAHKVVLSACSPYFRRLLKANPCQHPIIILRDVQQKDMESLLRFMYNGEVHIGQEHLTDFLKTAQMLQVRGLADVPTGSAGQKLTTSIPPDARKSPSSSSLPQWDFRDTKDEDGTSPPPSKRARSLERPLSHSHAEDYRTPERRSPSRGVDEPLEMRDSLLGQALEGSMHNVNSSNQKGHSDSSQPAQSMEDESSSDNEASDRERITPKHESKHEPSDYSSNLMDDRPMNGGSGGSDPTRPPAFPSALLGLQGLPGLMPGPSGMHGGTPDSFVQRRILDMSRVRATDPRPCPKCGKIYRSAHTLRTHLEDKHTICPGYRCVLCGTVAKSRNSLHSHMSRQHRGISTKDLPVLPMPSPFDPELASRLLAKAGVKITPAELRARASPTGQRRSDVKLEAKSAYAQSESESMCGDRDREDPEDLSISQPRYMEFTTSPPNMNHLNTTITKIPLGKTPISISQTPPIGMKSLDSLPMNAKEPSYPTSMPLPPTTNGGTTGSAILDTYLQLIAENSLGMGMTSEQAAAAVHAAKLAQYNAMSMDKVSQHHFFEKMQQQMTMVNDYSMKRHLEYESGRRGDERGDENTPMNHGYERSKKLMRDREGERLIDSIDSNMLGSDDSGDENDYSDVEREPEDLVRDGTKADEQVPIY